MIGGSNHILTMALAERKPSETQTFIGCCKDYTISIIIIVIIIIILIFLYPNYSSMMAISQSHVRSTRVSCITS